MDPAGGGLEMKKCFECNTYNNEKAIICSYCGNELDQYCNNAQIIINSFRATKIKKKIGKFPYDKAKALHLKIEQERKRVSDIQTLQKRIIDKLAIDKISNVNEKIKSYINTLILCEIDIKYYSIILSLSVINNEISDDLNYEVKLINEYCEKIEKQFNELFFNEKTEYSTEDQKEHIMKKHIDMIKKIEVLSLAKIGTILSGTSIVVNSDFGVENDYKELENNIDNINYEIDRLTAEINI